jgi:hypothetical protein
MEGTSGMNDYVLLELAKARQREFLQEADARRLAKHARAERPRFLNGFSFRVRLLPQRGAALGIVEPAACEC